MTDPEYVEKLERRIAEYQQREVEDLRERLSQMTHERDHYRSEASRNAEVGRQIAQESEREITKLRAELEQWRRESSYERRFGARNSK